MMTNFEYFWHSGDELWMLVDLVGVVLVADKADVILVVVGGKEAIVDENLLNEIPVVGLNEMLAGEELKLYEGCSLLRIIMITKASLDGRLCKISFVVARDIGSSALDDNLILSFRPST